MSNNMSYCRYQNTLMDLEDCFYAMKEEEFNQKNGIDELSPEEKKAKKELIELCEEISMNFGNNEKDY